VASRSSFDHDIFISYAHEDRSTTSVLAAQLEDKGLDVWWDAELQAGQQFHDEILAHFTGSRKVVVLWSSHSVGSAFVLDEANRALQQRKLIPVALDGTTPPLGFGAYHTLSLDSQQPDPSELFRILGEDDSIQAVPPASQYKKDKAKRSYFFPIALLTLTVVLITGMLASDSGRNWLAGMSRQPHIAGQKTPATGNSKLQDSVYSGPPIQLNAKYSNKFSAFLSEQGLRWVTSSALLQPGDEHDDPASACYQKNHVPPESMWPNIMPLAKAIEKVSAQARRAIEVVSAYHGNEYHRCIEGRKNSRHRVFKAIEIRSRTQSPQELFEAFAQLKRNREFTGSIRLKDESLLLILDN